MHFLKAIPGPLYAISFLLLLHLGGCRKDPLLDDPDAKLEFSSDTIIFDTVFTDFNAHGNPLSATRILMVYNPYDKGLKTNIRLAGGANSPYRINIDGHASTFVNDYEIRKKDSLYIFVEVTIPPGGLGPFIVTDSIIFETNGNVQDIDLVAWGRDAIYLEDSVLGCNISWTKDKPYVIYNSVLVPEGCTLTIGAGTEVYSHSGSRIYVEGTLIVDGTAAEPVIFQGDRLEQNYVNVPGQWVGIRLLPKSKGNIIKFAEIKNAIAGVEVDSLVIGNPTAPKLTITETKITNMAGLGIAAFTAVIKASNLAICNCGQFTFLGQYGGNYELINCTFNNPNSRKTPAVVISNAPGRDPDTKAILFKFDLDFVLVNNIIWGSEKDELLLLDDPEGGKINSAIVQNNLLKTAAYDTSLNLNNNLINQEPKFLEGGTCGLGLDEGSAAIDAGFNGTPVTIDILGKPRGTKPDMGAFERQ